MEFEPTYENGYLYEVEDYENHSTCPCCDTDPCSCDMTVVELILTEINDYVYTCPRCGAARECRSSDPLGTDEQCPCEDDDA